jgi:hypothetical protein
MPGFDGTGPRGLGPMTGRGEGYCAIALPSPGTARAPSAQNRPYGYAGLAGVPVTRAAAPYAPAPYFLGGRPRLGRRFLRGRGRGRGPAPRSGRGRRRW